MIPFIRNDRGGTGMAPDRTAEIAPESADGPRISVVIPTCRRPQLLCKCLAAVFAQRLDPHAFEVIVVDDGHGADTRTRASRPALPAARAARTACFSRATPSPCRCARCCSRPSS